MKFESIENIIVWQKARTLGVQTHAIIENVKDAELKRKLWKETITIMNTIAEWYEKPTKKDLIDSLYTAKWYCGKYRSMLHMVMELGFIDNTTHQNLMNASLDVTKLLAGFIKKLKEVKPWTEAA